LRTIGNIRVWAGQRQILEYQPFFYGRRDETHLKQVAALVQAEAI